MLERSRIAAEMKDLDQPVRASLRKWRASALITLRRRCSSPRARLASLLWALLKHDTVDLSALTGAQHLAARGRTSFPRRQGARCRRLMRSATGCGDRAIRVDILERLCRPGSGWRVVAAGLSRA